MIKGRCACGGVRFEVDEVLVLTHCHCSICRKLSGAAFASYAHVAKSKFRWIAGEDLIATYESTPGSRRTFCRACGSAVPGQAPYLPTMSIPAGLLDDDPVVRPSLHVFVSSKAPWWEITDDLPQYEKWVPGYEPKDKAGLTQLGRTTALPAAPDEAVLERVANPHADSDYLVRFTAPEFTTLCPVTGQPDFAHLVIDYAPDKWIVESKSLKLFLGSFRNHAGFHEDCTLTIGKRIASAIAPKWLRIGGYWYPRGGIPIDVFWQTGTLPEGLWVPEQGVAPYRGRG